jgi:hypothetical protein
MRIAVTLDVSWGNPSRKEIGVSDWIEKLKQQKAEETKDSAEKEKAKQRRHEVIHSKLTFFISQVTDKVRKEVEDLGAAFPDDARYQLGFQEEPPGFKLTNRNSRVFDLEFRLLLDPTQTMVRTVVAKHTPHTAAQPKQAELPVELDVNDRIGITYDGKRYFDPQELGEAITKFVFEQA